jgi:hypothetical protein
VRRHPEVRRLVSEFALSSMAEGFGAQTVILVGQDGAGRLGSVATRLAPSWNLLDPVAFETVGRLWRSLADSDSGDRSSELTALDGAWLLVCRSSTGSLTTATAVVRNRPFSSAEQATIERILRSVAVALRGEIDPALLSRLEVEVSRSPTTANAMVRLAAVEAMPAGNSEAAGCRHARAEDPDMVMAVARAAAELCGGTIEVTFAGQTRVTDAAAQHLVTVVVLQDADGPLFGLAVTDVNSDSGPAQAVFNAAGVVGLPWPVAP